MSSVDIEGSGTTAQNRENAISSKSLQKTELDTDTDLLSLSDMGKKENGRYRNRTSDPLVKSPIFHLYSLI